VCTESINGIIDPERQCLTAVKDVQNGFVPESFEDYGLDHDNPFPEEQCHSVVVPETVSPLPDSVAEARFFVESDIINIDEAVMDSHQSEHCHSVIPLISYSLTM